MNKYNFKNPLRTPSPRELATVELVEAEREKLKAETAREYATALVGYHAARIQRLKDYLSEQK